MDKWLKAEWADGKEAEIPVIGESVVLMIVPRDGSLDWAVDLGSLDVHGENGALYWESACGIASDFDGADFRDLLESADVYFTAVPPLSNRRFPPPSWMASKGGESVSASPETVSRAGG